MPETSHQAWQTAEGLSWTTSQQIDWAGNGVLTSLIYKAAAMHKATDISAANACSLSPTRPNADQVSTYRNKIKFFRGTPSILGSLIGGVSHFSLLSQPSS